MKKLFLALLLLLIPLAGVRADMIVFVTPGSSGGCGDYSSCAAGCKLFDWDCSTLNMGSNVCSQGDTSATANNEVDITTNPGKFTLVDGSNNGNDYYKFTVASYDIFPANGVTLEVIINLSTIGAGHILYVYFDNSNYFSVGFNLVSGNDIEVIWMGNGDQDKKTFDVNLSESQEYEIIVKADSVNGIALSINGGSSYTTDGTKTITAMAHAGNTDNLRIGNDSPYSVIGTIDNVRISSGWRTDI